MKLSSEYIMRDIAGEKVIVPVGGMSQKLNGLITLNEPAILIWKCLEEGLDEKEILAHMLEKFDVDKEVAKRDIDCFLECLLKSGFVE